MVYLYLYIYYTPFSRKILLKNQERCDNYMSIEQFNLTWEEMEFIYKYVAREKNKQWYKKNAEYKKAYERQKYRASKEANKL